MPDFLRAPPTADAGDVVSLLAGERPGARLGSSAGWRAYLMLAAGGVLVALAALLATRGIRPEPLAVRLASSEGCPRHPMKYQRLSEHPLVQFSRLREFARIRKVYMQWEMPALDWVEDLPTGEAAPKRLLEPEMLRQVGRPRKTGAP